jgi:hypothetical protein
MGQITTGCDGCLCICAGVYLVRGFTVIKLGYTMEEGYGTRYKSHEWKR